MTLVKCNLNDCVNNKNGICQKEDIDLDIVMDNMIECFDYNTQAMIDLRDKLRRELGII